MLQLHKILIGLVIISMIAVGLGTFITSGTSLYSVDETDATLSEEYSTTYNAMNEMSADLGALDNSSVDIDEDNQNDVLGGFFAGAYQSAENVKGTGNLYRNIVNDATSNIGILGSFGNTIKSGLGLMLTIVILIGLFLAFVIKFERV